MAQPPVSSGRDVLENDEIRLLYLHPNIISPIVHGTLVKVPNLSTYEYDALSYVWGNAADTVRAKINGEVVEITRNLDAALQQLRLNNKSRVLWVDALCINQSNIPERNSQVKRMGDIYERARHVRMWIGDSLKTLSAAAAFETLVDRIGSQAFSQAMDQHHTLSDLENSGALPRSLSDPLGFVLLSRDPDRIGLGGRGQGRGEVDSFFKEPYWSRIWVLQEVALAKNPIVHCGRMETTFQSILNFKKNLARLTIMATSSFSERSFSAAQALLEFTTVPDHFCLQVGLDKEGNSEQAVFETRHLQATDPRDKVYGLIGLWAKASPPFKLEMEIDYSKSVASVYTEFASALITKTDRLLVLAAAGINEPPFEPELDIASWVPDLRSTSHFSSLLLRGCWFEPDPTQRGYALRWRASSKHPCHYTTPEPAPQPTTSRGDYRLGIKGKVVLVITDRPNSPIELSTRILHLIGLSKRTRRCCLFRRRRQLADDRRNASLYRKLFWTSVLDGLAFRGREVRNGHFLLKRLIFGFCHLLGHSLEVILPVLLTDLNVHAVMTSDTPPAHDKSAWTERVLEEFEEYMKLKSENEAALHMARYEYLQYAGGALDKTRSYFVANHFRAVGVGPRACRVGDCIAAVAGCPVPVVLRQAEGRDPGVYRLVGPCYVAGLMQGQGIDDVAPGELEDIWLI